MPDPRSPAGPQAPPDIATKNQPPTGGRGFSGGGGGGFGGSGPGGGLPSAPIQKTYTVPPWFEVRPPSAREIGPLRGFQAGYTALNTPAVLPGTLTFTLPPARTGVIKSFGIQATNLLLTSLVFWTIMIDNSPVEGFTDVSLYPAALPLSMLGWGPDETNLIVPEASTITVGVNVLDGGAYQLGAELHGWHVASKLVTLTENLYRI